MSDLATRFRSILNGLKAVIATLASKDRPRATFLVLIHTHLNRTIQRFEILVAHWRANTLPKQRSRPGRTPRAPAASRLPTARLWLTRTLASTEANAYAAQLQHFLTTADATQLLAEVPRAARILRPLARALGLQMPGDPPPPPAKSSFTPTTPPDLWDLLPAHERIGVRVIKPAPTPFKKSR